MRDDATGRGLLPRGLRIESLSIEPGRVRISVSSSAATGSRCPVCGRGCTRTHSRYRRTVSDLG